MWYATNKLMHSYKGTEWKEHKYVYKKNGTYYYTDSEEDAVESTDDADSIGTIEASNKKEAERIVAGLNMDAALEDVESSLSESSVDKIIRKIQHVMDTPIIDIVRYGIDDKT